ncbi:MAG: hypothetical protein A2096_12960 [Spirochaetes bacterium GWF1_41_5]|nr:MAG: hypothetical protein A2096_12960 [Spirochaetes bacterium GWF1_41_5]HBE02904.1 hypothetical protein [Spirochaetia bacterium]
MTEYNNKTIFLPQQIYDKIREAAERELPDEACGYLAGQDDTITDIIPMTNCDHSPEHFSFDPHEQFAAARAARKNGQELIAVYHSHPASPAKMSDEDIKLAADKNIIYIIYSVSENRLGAFKIGDQSVIMEINIIIR